MATWEVQYKGHAIRVENGVTGEKLFVDGTLAAKDIHLLRSELHARIPTGEGAGEEVTATLKAGFLAAGCRVAVDGREVFRHSLFSIRKW